MQHAIKLGPDLSFQAPAGRRFTTPVIRFVTEAIICEHIGDLEGARAVLRDLEAQFDSEVGRKADRHRRSSSERNRATALLPKDEAPFTDRDTATIRNAEHKLQEASIHRQARNDRLARIRLLEARNLFVTVEKAKRTRSDARWWERVKAEIEMLERAIGGEAKVEKMSVDRNPVRLSSRDGLYSLSVAHGESGPRLTSAQVEAGLQYRILYESTDPQRALKPPPQDPLLRGSIGHGGEGYAEKRKQLWDDRFVIDSRVGEACGAEALTVLHEVAGKGSTMSSLCRTQDNKRSSQMHEAKIEMLRDALKVLMVIYRIQDSIVLP